MRLMYFTGDRPKEHLAGTSGICGSVEKLNRDIILMLIVWKARRKLLEG